MTSPILVPHDLTDLGDQGLDAAAALPIAAPRVVLHVLRRLDVEYPGVVWSHQDDEPRTAHAYGALARHLAAHLPSGVPRVVIGDPSSRIVEVARELNCQMIVMPSHRRSGLDRFLLGSVAERVARFAPCPVLLLPAGYSRPARPPPSRPVRPGRTRREQVEDLGAEIAAQVEARRGAYLTALRVGLPATEEVVWWERALEQELADSGLEFVDLVFTENPRPALLDARFEQRWA